MKNPDRWGLYRHMFRCRRFEEAVATLWQDGWIGGEMHLGIGEEALVAGVVDHLVEGDAMALDHRGTAALLVRGVAPTLLLHEFMGNGEGLCGGQGGHMHLFSRPHLSASTGIVGASAPLAAGFALAALHLRPQKIAVAFFGEGALNQGMLLESLNLAAAWRLPLLLVCKDNGWSITTRAPDVTAGTLEDRARGFGLRMRSVDGLDVEQVWLTAGEAIGAIRAGKGPEMLHGRCLHPQGHFLGDPLLRLAQRPVRGVKKLAKPLLEAFFRKSGGSLQKRLASLKAVMSTLRDFRREMAADDDPISRLREALEADAGRLQELEREVNHEVWQAVEAVMKPA